MSLTCEKSQIRTYKIRAIMIRRDDLIHVGKTMEEPNMKIPRFEHPRHGIRWKLIRDMARKYQEDPKTGFIEVELCFPKRDIIMQN